MSLDPIPSTLWRRKLLGGNAPISSSSGFNEKSMTVPEGKWWKIEAITLTFTTISDSATRTVHLLVKDSTNIHSSNELWSWRSVAGQESDSSYTYYFLPELTAGIDRSSINEIYAPFPSNIVLKPGFVIETFTENPQGGGFLAPCDAYSPFTIHGIEFFGQDPPQKIKTIGFGGP